MRGQLPPISRECLGAACRCWRALELDYEHAQAQWKRSSANTVTEREKTAGTDFENRDFWKFVSCMDCALEFAPPATASESSKNIWQSEWLSRSPVCDQ